VVAAGHRISFTGVVTYPKAPEVAECARLAEAGAFMLETDAPYLAPQPHRGRRCEPALLPATAGFIAEARGVAPDRLAAETTAAAEAFFRFGRGAD
jgi:TatD DNase family protein